MDLRIRHFHLKLAIGSICSFDGSVMGSERAGHKLGQIVLHSPYLRLAVLTAAAATVAYVIGGALALVDPVPAAITAVVATRATFHHAAKEALFQVIGVVAGSAVAFAAISLIGFGPATIAILVLASFGIIRLLQVADPRSAPYAAMAVAVTVMLVIGAHTSPEGALERFLGVMVGGACALVASYFTSRGKPVGRAEVELSSIQNELAELLNDVAQGVQMTLTPEITRTWFDKAVRLRDETMRLAVAVEDVRDHRRWSPAIHEFDLRELEQQLRVTQVMAARVLSIASDLNHLITERPAAGSSHELSPLAQVFAAAAATIADPTTGSAASETSIHQALQAADDTASMVMLGGLVGHAQRITRLGEVNEDEVKK